MALAVLFGLVSFGLAACGGKVIDWDLSRSHTPADVGFGKGDDDVLEFNNVKSVRIVLPRGLVYEADGDDVTQVIAHREGDQLQDISVTYKEKTAEDVVKQAKELSAKYGFTDGGFFQKFLDDVKKYRAEGDESKAQAHNGSGQPRGTKLALDEPGVGLTILDSFDDKKPWLIDFNIGWFYGDSYTWDFTKQHTVHELRFFPKDKDDYTIDTITELRIMLPGGKEFRVKGREGEARLKKNGETLTEVHTLFGEAGPEEAHQRALYLTGEWGVPSGPLDAWLGDVKARKAKGENEMAVPPALSAGPKGGPGEPVVSVGLHWEERYKLDPYELPWVVDFVVAWPG